MSLDRALGHALGAFCLERLDRLHCLTDGLRDACLDTGRHEVSDQLVGRGVVVDRRHDAALFI